MHDGREKRFPACLGIPAYDIVELWIGGLGLKAQRIFQSAKATFLHFFKIQVICRAHSLALLNNRVDISRKNASFVRVFYDFTVCIHRSLQEVPIRDALSQVKGYGNIPHLFPKFRQQVEHLLQESLWHTEEPHPGSILADCIEADL